MMMTQDEAESDYGPILGGYHNIDTATWKDEYENM